MRPYGLIKKSDGYYVPHNSKFGSDKGACRAMKRRERQLGKKIMLAAVLLSACASTKLKLVAVPASQPASAPASQPASQPIVPRPIFNRLALLCEQKISAKELQINDLQKQLTIKTADANAANAKVDQQSFELKAITIGGSLGAAAIAAGAALLAHFTASPAAATSKSGLIAVPNPPLRLLDRRLHIEPLVGFSVGW